MVLFQCRADQLLQFRVVEHLPPGQIGKGCRLCLRQSGFVRAAKGRRGLHNRPVILRADGARGEHERRSDDERP
jgi:hypothetical protein